MAALDAFFDAPIRGRRGISVPESGGTAEVRIFKNRNRQNDRDCYRQVRITLGVVSGGAPVLFTIRSSIDDENIEQQAMVAGGQTTSLATAANELEIVAVWSGMTGDGDATVFFRIDDKATVPFTGETSAAQQVDVNGNVANLSWVPFAVSYKVRWISGGNALTVTEYKGIGAAKVAIASRTLDPDADWQPINRQGLTAISGGSAFQRFNLYYRVHG